MKGKIVLKKYPNRRLYDTESCSYVTLGQVTAYIKDNRTIEVINSETGEDITASVLTNILSMMAKQGDRILPVSLLHLCIQYGESDLNDFFGIYLEKTLQSYIACNRSSDEPMSNFLKLDEKISENAVDALKQVNLFPWLDDYFSK